MSDPPKAFHPERAGDESPDTPPRLELVEVEAPKKMRKKAQRKPMGSFSDDVRIRIEELIAKYEKRFKRNPKAFKKRLLYLAKIHTTPFPKTPGKRKVAWITQAYRLWEQQSQEIKAGTRDKMNWRVIAKECMPLGTTRGRNDLTREKRIKNLRDAIRKRRKRLRVKRACVSGSRSDNRAEMVDQD